MEKEKNAVLHGDGGEYSVRAKHSKMILVGAMAAVGVLVAVLFLIGTGKHRAAAETYGYTNEPAQQLPFSERTGGGGGGDGSGKAPGSRPAETETGPLDTDGDGLSDDVEKRLGTNPGNMDSDGDGIDDYCEVYILRTDPLSPDTDGDGVSDFAEILAGTDPLRPGGAK